MESDMKSEEENPTQRSQKRFNIKWRYVFVVFGFLGMLNDYALRVNLNVAIVEMIKPTSNSATNGADTSKGEFEWTNEAMIKGSFYWGYIVTQIPGGVLAKKYGPKWVFGIGMLVTIIMTFLSPALSRISSMGLVAARVIEGLGEGVTIPAMQAMISNWAPVYERTKMTTLIMAGNSMGIVVGLPLSGWLTQTFGWEWAFYGPGIVSLIWFIGWCFLVYNSPKSHPYICEEEKDYILANVEEPGETPHIPWRKVLTSVPVMVIIVTYFLDNWGWYTLMTELPSYIDDVLGYDLQNNSLVSSLPYISFIIFNSIAGYLTDLAKRKKWASNTVIRKVANTIALTFPAIALLGVAFGGTNSTLVLSCFVLSGFFNGAKYSGYWSTLTDLAPNYAGALFGIGNMIATIPGFLSPIYTKALTPGEGLENTSGWKVVFITASVWYLTASAIFLVFATGATQEWNFISQSEKASQKSEVENTISDTSKEGTSNPAFDNTHI